MRNNKNSNFNNQMFRCRKCLELVRMSPDGLCTTCTVKAQKARPKRDYRGEVIDHKKRWAVEQRAADKALQDQYSLEGLAI